MTRRRFESRDERGSVVIFVAITLIVLLGIAALVIDLAIIRQSRAAGKSATDFASTAGAATLADEKNPRAACVDAFLYFADNEPSLSVSEADAAAACAAFPSGVADCDDASARNDANVVRTGFDVVVSWPIQDGDPLLAPDAIGDPGQDPSSFDGRSCERIAVWARIERNLTFARIWGQQRGRTSVHSVGRGFLPDPYSDQPAALVILDPTDCDALVARGSGSDGTHPQIEVKAVPVTENGETIWQPGLIALDSDASDCGSGEYVIRRDGSAAWIEAEGTPDPPQNDGPDPAVRGAIQAVAMGTDPARVWQGPTANGIVDPEPTLRSAPVTRLPMDLRYNCGTTRNCAGATSAFGPIDTLRNEYGQGTGLTPAGPYGGGFSDPRTLGLSGFSPGSCSLGGPPSTYVVVPAGNWIIDCALFEVTRTLVFEGGNVIFTGGLRIAGSGQLHVNYDDPDNVAPVDLTPGAGDSFVYIRDGSRTASGLGLDRAGGTTIRLHQTFMLIEEGGVRIEGEASNISWTAPCDDEPSCVGDGGVREDFEDLILWAEDASAATWRIAGNGNMHISGIVFTPEADPFEIQGVGLDAASKAQFWVERLDVAGNGNLVMVPDPTRTQPIPPEEAVTLIR